MFGKSLVIYSKIICNKCSHVRYLHFIISFILLVCFYSCQNVKGLYYDKGFNGATDSRYYEFTRDSFYHYGWNDILGDINYNGTWKYDNDTVLIKLNKPWAGAESSIIELDDKEEFKQIKGYTILSRGDTMDLILGTIILNEKDTFLTNENAVIQHSIDSVKTIHASDIFFQDTVLFIVNNPISSNIIIYLGESNEIQPLTFYWVHDTLIKKGKRLYIPNEEGIYKKSEFNFKRHKLFVRKDH